MQLGAHGAAGHGSAQGAGQGVTQGFTQGHGAAQGAAGQGQANPDGAQFKFGQLQGAEQGHAG